jgi:hypothetical protein
MQQQLAALTAAASMLRPLQISFFCEHFIP